MILRKIQLFNFANYEELTLEFGKKLNVITGKNGSGKTNLLDAIHYLCLTKSAFRLQDRLNIRHDSEFFMIRGEFEKNNKLHQILASFQPRKKKIFQVNEIDYERISEHIGKFPCVLITPYDTDLIREGSEIRRKFFDNLISQTDRLYLENLMRYNRLLKNRNELLKQFYEFQNFDADLLETFDIQLIDLAQKIYIKRQEMINSFLPTFQKYYRIISESQEEATFSYVSHLSEGNFKEIFQKVHSKDRQLQRTTKGIHRDDFKFQLNQYPIQKFGSQGQQKSFVLALKLAQFTHIQSLKKVSPILMLDDIFDKLDEKRMQQLVEMVSGDNFGQVFITDARSQRSQEFFEGLGLETTFFERK